MADHQAMTLAPWRWLLVATLALVVGGAAVALYDHRDGSSSSSTKGSGVPATQVRAVAAFDRVELAGANNVVVHVGGERHVVVKADDNLLGRVTTKVRGSTLVVANTRGSFSTRSPMSVDVTVPSLTGLTLSGSGNIVVSGVKADRLEVSLPGSGTLTGSGTAGTLDVTVAGSGAVEFMPLVAKDVRAAVSGSGSIFVMATNRLNGSVSGSGAIIYAGHPAAVTKDVTGSGAITGG
jgi:Putative auto-transporter adhesin, head GIN domain